MAYEFKSRIRFSEVGPDRRQTFVSLADYFQDASTFQSEELGVGMDYLYGQGCVWMILFWQIDILHRPVMGEHVVVQTWPYGFDSLLGYRNFALLGADGEKFVIANSVWALLDLKTGRPMRLPAHIKAGYVLEEKQEMDYLPRKISLPKEGGVRQEEIVVTRQYLDTNLHVNNGQYISMAEQYLPEGFAVRRLLVEYKSQARLRDVIVPVLYKEESALTVSLEDASGRPYAVVRFCA